MDQDSNYYFSKDDSTTESMFTNRISLQLGRNDLAPKNYDSTKLLISFLYQSQPDYDANSPIYIFTDNYYGFNKDLLFNRTNCRKLQIKPLELHDFWECVKKAQSIDSRSVFIICGTYSDCQSIPLLSIDRFLNAYRSAEDAFEDTINRSHEIIKNSLSSPSVVLEERGDNFVKFNMTQRTLKAYAEKYHALTTKDKCHAALSQDIKLTAGWALGCFSHSMNKSHKKIMQWKVYGIQQALWSRDQPMHLIKEIQSSLKKINLRFTDLIRITITTRNPLTSMNIFQSFHSEFNIGECKIFVPELILGINPISNTLLAFSDSECPYMVISQENSHDFRVSVIVMDNEQI